MKTKLKTYRSEAKLEADRPLMEAQGWRVRAVQQRPRDTASAVPHLDHGLPELLDRFEARQHTDLYIGRSVGLSGPYPYAMGSPAGCIRLLVLPFALIAWPFAWLRSKWRSGPRWDVLYERA